MIKKDTCSSINVHIYPSPFTNESRMLKITNFLEKTGRFSHIYVIATAEKDLPESEKISDRRTVIRLHRGLMGNGLFSKTAGTLEWYIRVWSTVKQLRPSCINCHSLSVLPLCVLLKAVSGAKLVYDTHELETESVASLGLRKVISKITERLLIKFVNETVVVNKYIGQWYQQSYNLQRVWVVQNMPERQPNVPAETSCFRNKLSIPASDRIFLYQGEFGNGRGIEFMLTVFAHASLSDHLVLLGYGAFTDLIIDYASKYPNIHYHPAVSPKELPSYTAVADVGLCLIENVCLSYYHCLPNKLFEYVSCGVPVIASDFPEMSHFLEKFGCGWSIKPTEKSLAEFLQSLDQKTINSVHQKAIDASKQFCWKMEEPKLGVLYDALCFIEDNKNKEKAHI